MALSASIVWEVMQNATAGNVNGGGFKTGASGTDYSQQTTAHLTITDLVIGNPDNTTVSSALTPFDAQDVGNVLHITAGTGFTVGWYEVTAVNAGVATLDRACGTAGSTGGSAYLGGALSLNSTLDNDFFSILLAGHTVWIKYNASVIVLGEAVSLANDGTTTSPIIVEGYNTTRGDNPTETNRPTLSCGANTFAFDDYWIVKHLIITGTPDGLTRIDVGGIFENCKVTNTSVTANREAIQSGGAGGLIINCEVSSTNGAAIDFTVASNSRTIFGCYIHDSSTGIKLRSIETVVYNIIDTCTTAIDMSDVNADDIKIIGNTLYSGTTGITGGANDKLTLLNNIIDSFTTGVTFTSQQDSNYADYNNYNNNTTNRTNIMTGDHDTAVAPGFVDAPNGNFSITGDI